MTDYSKMSDFEINEAVSMALLSQSKNPEAKYVAVGNYCNSWADAGPIAEKYRIGTMPSGDGNHMAWSISKGLLGDVQAKSTKLCRAICIVFLMMNEGE